MGEKVNFNSKKNKKNINKLKIIGIVLIAILIIYILVQSLIKTFKSFPKNNVELKESYYKVSDYGSLEEILKNYECKLVSKDETNGVLTAYLTFKVDLYTGNTSNERYFNDLCRVLAEYQKFKDFELIDNTKNIKISVKCEDKKIVELKINDDINYYSNHDSEINSKKVATSSTRFTIQSKELQQLIDGNWDETKVDWGSRESTCNGYNIYFDEGVEYKVVGRTVYNVIFTEKYGKSIAGGLNASSTQEEVKKSLGEPTFNDYEMTYGYLGENNYLFFDFTNKIVSIYPVVKVTEEEEEKLKEMINEMNETSDVKDFTLKLTDFWIDYDKYNYDSSNIDLRYTLRGINFTVSANSLKNGIYIYQNYSGNRDIKNLDNVYFADSDMVFNEEKSRIMKSYLNRNDEGDFTEKDNIYMGTEFTIRFQGELSSNETGNKGPMFFARDRKYPDSELSKTLTISSYMWYDDYNFVYSVDDDGIYVYNCISKNNLKLQDVAGKIKISSVKEGKIIYNENLEILVNAQ